MQALGWRRPGVASRCRKAAEKGVVRMAEWAEAGASKAGAGKSDATACRAWFEGDPLLEDYHDHEWCKPSHDDRFQFEMLCLEGASTGLSWKTIMRKRRAYLDAFCNFDVAACAALGDVALEGLLENPGIVRNRAKVFGVRRNARAVLRIQRELGSFDAYLWDFVGGSPIDGHWASVDQIPTKSDESRRLSADLRHRGMVFVGPTITYSFMQAVGLVNDHLRDCPCR